MPTYEVVDIGKGDTPLKTQVTVHAIVGGRLTRDGLDALLDKMYREANSRRDFTYHGGRPTHVVIYLYVSRAHYESGMGQWIAMLDKVGEDAEPHKKVRTQLLEQMSAEPETRLGLTEDKRQEVFRLLVQAEDRAQLQAERQYPLPDPLGAGYSQNHVKQQLDKQYELERRLLEGFKADLARRYGITRKQLDEIGVEGLQKDWPMPPPR